MDFNSLLLLNLGPASFEFLLHFTPDSPRLVIKGVNLHLCLLLEHIEAVFALDDGGFLHQVLKLSEGRVSLIAAPGSLELDRSEDTSVWASETVAWIVDGVLNLDAIRDTSE